MQHEDAAVPEVARRRRDTSRPSHGSGFSKKASTREAAAVRRRAPRRGECSRSRYAAPVGTMPNSTSLPVAAIAAARLRLAAKPARPSTTWSDGMTAIMASADFCAERAARQRRRPRAVLRATGSRMIASARHGRARQLLAHEEAMVVVADDDRRGKVRVVDAPQRGAEQAALPVEEADELLGIHGPRQRPQPRARAAGQNDWNDPIRRHQLPRPLLSIGNPECVRTPHEDLATPLLKRIPSRRPSLVLRLQTGAGGSGLSFHSFCRRVRPIPADRLLWHSCQPSSTAERPAHGQLLLHEFLSRIPVG